MRGDDAVEDVLEFERKRANWRLFLAQLDFDEALLIADDVKRMLNYKANQIEKDNLNRAYLMGGNFTVVEPPSPYDAA